MSTQRGFFDDPPVDMSQPAVSLDRGRRRGRLGASLAASHADRASLGWMRRACAAVLVYARRQSAPWLGEQARTAAEAQGLTEPPDKRAWGAVFQTLKRRGYVATAGYAPAASSNGSPKCLWTRGPITPTQGDR